MVRSGQVLLQKDSKNKKIHHLYVVCKQSQLVLYTWNKCWINPDSQNSVFVFYVHLHVRQKLFALVLWNEEQNCETSGDLNMTTHLTFTPPWASGDGGDICKEPAAVFQWIKPDISASYWSSYCNLHRARPSIWYHLNGHRAPADYAPVVFQCHHPAASTSSPSQHLLNTHCGVHLLCYSVRLLLCCWTQQQLKIGSDQL